MLCGEGFGEIRLEAGPSFFTPSMKLEHTVFIDGNIRFVGHSEALVSDDVYAPGKDYCQISVWDFLVNVCVSSSSV